MKKLFFAAALLCANVLAFAAPDVAAPTPTIPANQVKSLYSDAYVFAPASLNSYNEGWWNPPTLTEETIGEDHVLHYNLYQNGMIGVQFGTISVSKMEKIHIDIYSSVNGSLRFRPVTVDGPGDNLYAELVLEANKWNSFDMDMATDFPGHNWSNLFQYAIQGFAEGGMVGADIWVDNIFFYTTQAPEEDTEAPTDFTAVVESVSFFSAKIKANATDNSGEVTFTVFDGEQEVGKASGESGKDIIIPATDLISNTEYTLSVIASDESGNATEPIAVVVKTEAGPTPAEAPIYAEENVLALYSDYYTTIPFAVQDWWSMPAISFGSLTADSKAFCIDPTGTPEGGCFGLAFAKTDVTSFDALEMDVFATTEASVLDVQVIGIGEASTAINLVTGAWNHIVLDIKGNTKTDCEQVGFYNCGKLTGICFVQNVLFMKEAQEGVENVNASVKAVKTVENGQMVIIKNGVRYNVIGSEVR